MRGASAIRVNSQKSFKDPSFSRGREGGGGAAALIDTAEYVGGLVTEKVAVAMVVRFARTGDGHDRWLICLVVWLLLSAPPRPGLTPWFALHCGRPG